VPNLRWLLALITAVHRFVYQRSGGRVGGRLPGKRFLLLTTIGRRTGLPRVTPLLYIRDGDRFVVVGSNAGDDRPPAWWRNLQQRPAAQVQAGRQQHLVSAHQAHGAELDALWPRLESSYRYYADYRRRTTREIPVVVLEPAKGPAASV
jgi:deazaflavin-dependent oxidoreductase (nitroreductase family)